MLSTPHTAVAFSMGQRYAGLQEQLPSMQRSHGGQKTRSHDARVSLSTRAETASGACCSMPLASCH